MQQTVIVYITCSQYSFAVKAVENATPVFIDCLTSFCLNSLLLSQLFVGGKAVLQDSF